MDLVITKSLGFLADIGGMLGKLNIAGLTENKWMIPGFVVFIVALVGLTMGRSRIVIATFCIYAAYFIETHFPYFLQLKSALKILPSYWVHIGLFFILLIIIFLVFNRSFLRRKLSAKDASIFQILLLAIFNVGFLFSVIVSYLPSGVSFGVPAETMRLFNNKAAQVIWAILPIAAVLFIKSKKETVSVPSSRR